jgi:hypothetical protein
METNEWCRSYARAVGSPAASLAALNLPWVQRFHWPSVRVPSRESLGNTMPSGAGRPLASNGTVRSAPVLVPFKRPIELAPLTAIVRSPTRSQVSARASPGRSPE